MSAGTQDSTTTGTAALLRFALRRERRRLPWWILGAGALLAYQSVGSQALYDSPESLENLRTTLGENPAIIAFSGPPESLATIGGEILFEVFAFVAIVVALMNTFLVGRHTRSDEETGRAELIRSAKVGRDAPLVAALLLAGLANAAVAVVIFAAAAGTGLPVGGSVLVGLAVGLVGLTFAGLTAVAAQVFESARGVYGVVAFALGLAFVLRAAGDAGDGTLSWLSPIGWGQRTFPYVHDRWWPLLIPVVVTPLLTAGAIALVNRRDFGAGLVRSRPGRATASTQLGSPLGLAWRLQRGSFIGWTIGIVLMGVGLGSFGEGVEQFAADTPEFTQVLPGGAADVVDAYLAFSMAFVALLAAAFGITSALRARSEETSGRAEPVLATATSRSSWLGSHLTIALGGSALALVAAGLCAGLTYGLAVSDPGQAPRVAAVAVIYVPAVWAVIGVAVLGFGWLPGAAAIMAWIIFAYCAVIAFFADAFDLPAWSQDASPFKQTPGARLESVTAAPLLVIGSVVVVLLVTGFAGFRRRDVGY